MREVKKFKIDETALKILCYICMLMYKFTMDFSMYKIGHIRDQSFNVNFNMNDAVLGYIWCSLLFWSINIASVKSKKASTFFLNFILMIQIIPLTTIYTFKNTDATFYNLLCLGYLICILLVQQTKDIIEFRFNLSFSVAKWLINSMILLSIILLVYIVFKNGLPTLKALNLADVYELRLSNRFQLNEFFGYVLDWTAMFTIPFTITKSMYEKKYIYVILAILFMFIIYLYSGNKIYIFAIPVCVGFVFISQLKYFKYFFFIILCIFFALLLIGVSYFYDTYRVFLKIYEFIINRTLLIPANLKFLYYDYFSTHEKLGFFGVIPVKFLWEIPDYYMQNQYQYEISRIYMNKPIMFANTGYFAEGFMRFGYLGVFLLYGALGLILKLIDNFQKKTNFRFAICMYILPIYTLVDGQLLRSIVSGPWLFWLIVLIFFNNSDNKYLKKDSRRVIIRL